MFCNSSNALPSLHGECLTCKSAQESVRKQLQAAVGLLVKSALLSMALSPFARHITLFFDPCEMYRAQVTVSRLSAVMHAAGHLHCRIHVQSPLSCTDIISAVMVSFAVFNATRDASYHLPSVAIDATSCCHCRLWKPRQQTESSFSRLTSIQMRSLCPA